MILYLDTSALVKKYFKEVFSEQIVLRWKQANVVATSAVTYAETMASIHRKKREIDPNSSLLDSATRAFQRDWGSFIRIEVSDDLNPFLDRLLETHPLRGFDAIHLASAIILNDAVAEELIFACFDKVLLSAAAAEGITTFPS